MATVNNPNPFGEYIRDLRANVERGAATEHAHGQAAHGADLVALHLLQSPKLDQFITEFPEKGTNEVDRVIFNVGGASSSPDGIGLGMGLSAPRGTDGGLEPRHGQETVAPNRAAGLGVRNMHYVTAVAYEADYRLLLTFEDGSRRRIDLASHLDGEMFEPLRDIKRFQTARLNADIDTVVWDNGADMSPDFLYEIGEPVDGASARKIAEDRTEYARKDDNGESIKT